MKNYATKKKQVNFVIDILNLDRTAGKLVSISTIAVELQLARNIKPANKKLMLGIFLIFMIVTFSLDKILFQTI